MRALLIPAAAAAFLATSAFGFAATQYHAQGTVKAFDLKAMTLSLADGSTYMLPKTFKDPGLKAGETVSIAWEQSGANKQADTVTIVK